MKKLLNLGLLLLGAAALTLTLATAEGKCGNAQKGMMDNSSKCGNSTKGMMNNEGKCDGDKNATKKIPAKGKCGQGKCG